MSEPGNPKKLNLALQGGGSHGAFTWGVLDRLLEEPELEISGVCGTSAGAMNAIVLAYGLARGGPAGAREMLAKFWGGVAAKAEWSPLRPSVLDRALSPGNMDYSPAWLGYDLLSRTVSPYVANPLNYNPLVDVLEDAVDFAWLRKNHSIPTFICATNVMTGRIRVFEGHEVTAKSVMASACLPFMYQAVEIGGEYFWDGGFSGNPPIYPLIYGTEVEDVLIVQVNPVNIKEVPKTALQILDRMNELSFNNTLMREMRAIHFVEKLLKQERVPHGRYKAVKVHTVNAEEIIGPLNYSSKINADRDFLKWLFDLGRERGTLFLEQHRDKIGVESSTDIEKAFL